jgi:hypothetical protein
MKDDLRFQAENVLCMDFFTDTAGNIPSTEIPRIFGNSLNNVI